MRSGEREMSEHNIYINEVNLLLKCSEKAENMKLGEMETWLDNQASKVNRNTKEYEYIFSLYNKINDIRTFYAQHLFNGGK